MVIGRGDIAKVIQDRDGFVFYCNGYAKRTQLTKAIEDKERKEVYQYSQQYKDAMFVYISTLAIYYTDDEYTGFKLRMEARVKKLFKNYCILRIGNITWGDNPNTLLNFFKNNPSAEKKDVHRYLIDLDEFNHWVSMIPKTGHHEMNLTGKRIHIPTYINNER